MILNETGPVLEIISCPNCRKDSEFRSLICFTHVDDEFFRMSVHGKGKCKECQFAVYVKEGNKLIPYSIYASN